MSIWVDKHRQLTGFSPVHRTIECVHVQNHGALSLDSGPLQLGGGIESSSWSWQLQRGQ